MVVDGDGVVMGAGGPNDAKGRVVKAEGLE